jgi:hypothetical protein
MFVMAPQGSQYDIGQHQVGDERARKNNPPPSATCNVLHALLPRNRFAATWPSALTSHELTMDRRRGA